MQKKFAVSLIGFIILLIWLQTSKYWCYSLVIPLLFLVLITKNSYTYAKAKKICLGKCYFNEKSLLYYFWTRKVYIFLVSLFVGTFLTTTLVMASTQFTFVDIALLFADTFLLVMIYILLEKNHTFNEEVERPIIKNITAWINSLLMVGVFFIVAYYQTPPEYLQTDFQSTLDIIQKQNYSRCERIDFVAYVSSGVIALKWWLLAKATFMLENQYFLKLLWIVQLLGNYMMLFAYSRFILEMIDLFTNNKHSTKENENG